MPQQEPDITDDILTAARAVFRRQGWFTCRDVYAELCDKKCPRNTDRPFSLHKISTDVRNAGAVTILRRSNGYTRYIFGDD